MNQAQQQGPTPAGTLQDVAPDATPARSPSGHQSKDLNDSVSTFEVNYGDEGDGACSWVVYEDVRGGREAVPTHCSM